MPELNTVSFIDRAGKRCEAVVDVHDYMEAAKHKKSLSQYYALKFPTDDEKYGSSLEQFAMVSGIRVRGDEKRGIPASTMYEVFHGTDNMIAGTIVRPQAQSANNIASRILFPEVLMQMVNDQLLVSKEDYLVPFENAIGLRTSVVGARVDQPRIDVTAPESSRAQPISQLAEPAVMITITLNSKQYTIPTKSIGLQISDEAMSVGIDVVALSVAAQARGERIARLEADMANIINGDLDSGVSAVSFVNASTFDPTINAGNPITHLAWVSWLRQNYQKMTVTNFFSTLESAIQIEARTGRPQAQTDLSSQANRFPADFSIENLGMPSPRGLLLPAAVTGVDRIVGFDRQYALHQITNISASYSAIENYVLRRATAYRFDYGTTLVKLYDTAFTGLVLGV